MSNCIKDLYDYDLVKKCSKCENISLKSNFHKNKNRIDGLQAYCISCQKEYRKKCYLDNHIQIKEHHKRYKEQNREKIRLYENNRRKTDLNFKIACNLRSRTSTAFKSQNVMKTKKRFDLLGCSHSFFQRWIIHQLYGNMTIENYGSVWQIDHCLPIASFNLLDENDIRKCFSWINLRPMYSNENNFKKAKIDHRLYLLQQIKAKYFTKINEERFNEDLNR